MRQRSKRRTRPTDALFALLCAAGSGVAHLIAATPAQFVEGTLRPAHLGTAFGLDPFGPLAWTSGLNWIFLVPSVLLFLVAVWGRSLAVACCLGLLRGACFWFAHISWLGAYLGPAPWLALASVMTLWSGLLGLALAWCARQTEALWPHRPVLNAVSTACVIAGIWTTVEFLSAIVPYGGFSWGRLALSQVDGPFSATLAWVGLSGFTFCFIAALTVPVAVWRRSGTPRRMRARARAALWRHRWAALAIPVGVAAIAALLPASALPTQGTFRVGAVQGNSDSAIFSSKRPGDALNDHYQAAQSLRDEQLDLMVWPEGAIDVDLRGRTDAQRLLDSITAQSDAPLLAGTATRSADGRFFQSAILWRSELGIVDQVDKRHPVPFAEYMPNRAFFRALAPDLVDLVQLDLSPGERPVTMTIGGTRVGVAICFDIVDDSILSEMVGADAGVIISPSNNADFGRTNESAQQLAIARARAIETGRFVVNISTVGTSAVLSPSGTIPTIIAPFQAGSFAADVPVVSGSTLASVLSPALVLLSVLSSVLLCALVALRRIRKRRVRLAALPRNQSPGQDDD